MIAIKLSNMENEMILQNPWWKDPNAIEADEKIAEALSKTPVTSYSFDEKTTNQIILGPRQVGKTTMLKFHIRDLLKKGIRPRNILYFSCEPLRDKNDIISLISTLDKLSEEGKKYVFLDEITKVKEWELGVKFFLDSPLKKNKHLVVTGSNALFLKHGAERMPGRDIETRLDLPLSFREFLLHFGSKKLIAALEKTTIRIDVLDAESIEQSAKAILPFSDEIERLFRTYTKTGGFLRAIYEYFEIGHVSERTYEVYVRWILGDLSAMDKSEQMFRGVIRGIVKNYSSPTTFLSIARDTETQSHTTVSDYLCTAQDLLLANVLFAGDLSKKIPLPRKERKYYFTDPFLYSAFSGYLNGKYQDYSEENLDKVVEGIVCESLARQKRMNLDHSFFLWYFKKNKETDFVLSNEKGLIGLEVKWTQKTSPQDFANFFSFKSRILLVKNGHEYIPEKNLVMVPVALFLAMI